MIDACPVHAVELVAQHACMVIEKRILKLETQLVARLTKPCRRIGWQLEEIAKAHVKWSKRLGRAIRSVAREARQVTRMRADAVEDTCTVGVVGEVVAANVDAPPAASRPMLGANLAVVLDVLREAAQPLSVQEIIELAGSRLPSKSKTPHTVVARDLAMEIKTKGDAAAIVRTAPGRFALKEVVPF